MALFLVTGAAGFIGAALAKRLIEEGHRVVTIDNLSTGHECNIPTGAIFFRAGCHDREVYGRLPQEKYKAIFHFAGQSSAEISFEDPSYDLRANTESTLHLLRFARSVGCDRFIYASSMSVYGVKPDRPVRENEEAVPVSFYGVAKLGSEHYLRIYEQYGVQSTALRLFTVYGPGQNLANMRQGMVSIYLSQMLASQRIHVKGRGCRYRDFVYIDDVIDACVACVDVPQCAGRILNIGTGVRTTVEELVRKLVSLYGRPVAFEFSGSTPGDVDGIYADITLARQLLGFQPKYALDQGLAKVLEWAVGQGTQGTGSGVTRENAKVPDL